MKLADNAKKGTVNALNAEMQNIKDKLQAESDKRKLALRMSRMEINSARYESLNKARIERAKKNRELMKMKRSK